MNWIPNILRRGNHAELPSPPSHCGLTSSPARETLAVDTLLLNPLAIPQNPYLMKHYQDGHRCRGRINDPEFDVRLTLEAFENQQRALCEIGAEGFDIVFSALCQVRRPSDRDARDATSPDWKVSPVTKAHRKTSSALS